MAQPFGQDDRAALEAGLQGRRRFKITDPNSGQSLTVEGIGPPPTPEEASDIFTQVVGSGRYTRGDLPAAGATAGSIGGSMVLGSLAKKMPHVAALSGLGGGIGEFIKQVQTPDNVGRWDITNIQEPALMGATTIDHDPRSLVSRAKMVAARGGEETGIDLLGSAIMQLPRWAARQLQSFSLSGQPDLQRLKALDPDLIEQSLLVQPPVAPQQTRAGRKWLPWDPLRAGRSAGEERRNIFGVLQENVGPAKIRESMQQLDDLLAEVNAADVPLTGMDRGSLFRDMLASDPGVAGKDTLADFLQMSDDIRLAQAPTEPREMGEEYFSQMRRFWDNYVNDPTAREAYGRSRVPPGTPATEFMGAEVNIPRSPRRTSEGDISLRQAVDDKRFLEQYMLGPLYESFGEGRGGPAVTRTTAILKALRDALDTRIHDTLRLGDEVADAMSTTKRGAAHRYDAINRRTQQLNRLFQLVKQSPAGYSGFSTILSPLASVLARGTHRASRLPLPQTGSRAIDILSTEATPPGEDEIARMAPTRENAARLALSQPERDQPSWLMEMIADLRRQAAEGGPTMASIIRRGQPQSRADLRGPPSERDLVLQSLGIVR
jgi:hypothetical protein